MLRHLVRSLCLLLAAGSLQAQTQFVYDEFTGTNGTLLESHAPSSGGAWSRLSGNGLLLDGGRITPDKTNGNDVYTNAAVPPSAEYVVGMEVTFVSTNNDNYARLYARVSGATGYYVHIDGGSNYRLVRVVGGVETILASGTTTALDVGSAEVNELVFFVTNASKRLILNGTVIATTADNTIAAAGRAGLGLQVKTKEDSFADDFYASSLAPTAVEMDTMGATRDAHRALLTWTTGRTSDNLGYSVWREVNGERVCLTPTPIAGSAFFATTSVLNGGTAFRWLDSAAPEGATYWIEELDLHGGREWHGPLVPEAGRIAADVVPAPKLSELAPRAGVQRTATRELLRSHAEPAAGTNFELAASDALKLSVTAPGIHEVAIPAGADAATLRLFEDGREIPIVQNANTIQFYGTPLDTPESGTRVYWLTWNGAPGERIAQPAKANGPLHGASGFLSTIEVREKAIFAAALQSEDGDGFFGPVITNDASAPAKQILRLADVDRSAATAQLALTIMGATDGAHRIAVTVNGHAAGTVDLEGWTRAKTTLTVNAAWLRDGDNEIVLRAQNGADDISALEAARFTYARKYALADGSLLFTAPGGTRVRLAGTAGAPLIAFDVTDPARPLQLATSGDIVDVAGTGERTLIATTRTLAPHVAANEPSALHATPRGAFAILAPRALLPALAPLAARRNGAVLAAIEDVYDEFSFGAKDTDAIRAFAGATRPRAILLAGDGSYDPRDYAGGGAADLVPVKLVDSALQRTPSDAWFTDFDDDGIADIAIGRLPARTPAEMQAMVAKIVSYETTVQPTGDIVSVSGTGAFDTHRSRHSTEHIDLDTEGIAAARQHLLQRWSAGAGLIGFVGHGSVEMWETAGFFSAADAATAGDGAPLPLVVAMTCLNGYFHDAAQESLAEALLRNSDGGAAAVWAFSTLTETSGQLPANDALLAALTAGKTLGEATIAAQRATSDPDVRKTLLLFGDPTMKLRGARAPVRRRAMR